MIPKQQSIENIKGWFLPKAMELFVQMDAAQKQRSITGNIMEIGVYHGRSAVLLGQFLADGEEFHACDTFTGYDNDDAPKFLDTFLTNYRNVVGNPVDHLFDCPSSRLGKMLSEERKYRIWHIDGYHSYEMTCKDMMTGYMHMADDGMMIVDDFLNQDWLGVNQAVNEFLNAVDDMAIFAYGYNKLFLCKADKHEMYHTAAKQMTMPQSTHNFLPFHGFNWVSFK